MNRTPSRLLLVLLVLVLCAVGFGFYRDWFALSSTSPDAGNHKVNINLTVDPDKMKADTEMVKEKTTTFAGQEKEEANELGNRVNDGK